MLEEIIFIYTNRSSFVERDIRLLTLKYNVKCFEFSQQSKFLLPITFLKQAIFLITHFKKSRTIIIQFGGYHSFLPVLLKNLLNLKCVIIAGGVDCMNYPEIGYGYMKKLPISYFTKYSFRNCDLILPKHQTLINFTDNYNYPEPVLQGLKSYIPDLRTPYIVIENGFDYNKFKRTKNKIKGSFIAGAFGLDKESDFKLKGIDLIFEVAKYFPDCTFNIIGGSVISNKNNLSKNINLLLPLKEAELIEAYSSSQFYLQLSMTEGFPNSICEAMLCECVPIGSNVNSIPEIIGDTGFLLQHRDVEELRLLIEKAISDIGVNEKSLNARKRIIDNFNLEKRSEKLLKSITELEKS